MPSLGLQLKPESARVGGAFYSTSITYLGRENNTLADSYAVSNWSSTAVAKKLNPSANRYGTSGYYQIRPGATNFAEGVGNNNDFGISAATSPTLYSHPSFATVLGGAGTFVNFGGYPNFLGNDGVTQYRQGAISIPVNQGPFTSPSGVDSSYFGQAFSVTLNQDATFLLGIAVDTAADRQYAPKYVSVFSSATGSVFSASIPSGSGGTSIPRLAVFLIRGKAGEQFISALWQDAGSNSVAPFSLITLDRLM